MMLEGEISPMRQKAADCLRIAADKLSEFRIYFADVIVEEIEAKEDFQSWGLVRQVGKACLTDVADGIIGRFSNELLGTTPSEENSRIDGDADKEMYHKTIGALATAATARYPSYSNSLRQSLATNEERDARVIAKRDEIGRLNEALEPGKKLSTKANRWGQAKTWVNSFALGFAVSPWAGRRFGRRTASGLYKVGAWMSLKSEAGINASIDAQMNALDAAAPVTGV